MSQPKLAILASGSGTTAEAVAQSIDRGELNAEIAIIIHDKPNAKIVEQPTIVAQNIPTLCISGKTHPKTEGEELAVADMTAAESAAIVQAIENAGADVVLLLGYMRKVSGLLLVKYGFNPETHFKATDVRMLNTHPGPLPQTKGLHGEGVHQRVYELMKVGELTHSGPTLHAVAADYDTGPVFRYAGIVDLDVMSDTPESIEDRVRKVERDMTGPEVQQFLNEIDI